MNTKNDVSAEQAIIDLHSVRRVTNFTVGMLLSEIKEYSSKMQERLFNGERDYTSAEHIEKLSRVLAETNDLANTVNADRLKYVVDHGFYCGCTEVSCQCSGHCAEVAREEFEISEDEEINLCTECYKHAFIVAI